MSRLEDLRKANPDKEIICVTDAAFKPYGRVVRTDETEMCAIVKTNVEINDSETHYVTYLPVLDSSDVAKKYSFEYCGQLDEQWGLCWGHNSLLNGLEWHTCNEFNIGVTDCVLMLAKRADIDDNGKLDSKAVKFFYLPENVMVEVYSDTLHYAPCEVDKNGFYCVVGLQRGTNEDLAADKEHSPLLTAANKWLIAQEDTDLAKVDGVLPNIYGENWELKTI